MNQSHHVEPSPYIHSNVRRFVAPEMQDKLLRSTDNTKPAGKRISVLSSAASFEKDYRATFGR